MTTLVDEARDRQHGHAVRVVIVDDHCLLAQSVAVGLRLRGIECHVPQIRDAQSLLVELLDLDPSLVLLDLDLGPEAGSGVRLIGPLLRAGVRVLVVSASTDRNEIASALEEGAMGAVSKEVAYDELTRLTIAAARGEEVMSPAERATILNEARLDRARLHAELAPFERLSEREAEVLCEIVRGHNVSTIARRGVVTEATVRSQVRSILTKLGVSSQLEAVALAHRSGWVDLQRDLD